MRCGTSTIAGSTGPAAAIPARFTTSPPRPTRCAPTPPPTISISPAWSRSGIAPAGTSPSGSPARPRLPAGSPLRTANPLPIRHVVSLGGLQDLEQDRAETNGCGSEVIDQLVGPPTPPDSGPRPLRGHECPPPRPDRRPPHYGQRRPRPHHPDPLRRHLRRENARQGRHASPSASSRARATSN